MTSPETQPSTSPEVDAHKGSEVFSPQSIEEMRAKQRQLLIDALENIDPYDKEGKENAKKALFATFDNRTKEYLKKESVVTGDDDPRMEKALEYLRMYSIDKMNEDDWLYGKEENGTHTPSGREVVKEDYRQLATPETTTTTEPTETKEEDEPETKEEKEKEKTEEEKEEEKKKAEEEAKRKEREERRKARQEKIKALESQLGKLAEDKHKAFADRMAVKAFSGKKRKEMDKAYDDAEEAYLRSLEELRVLQIEQKNDVEDGPEYDEALTDAQRKNLEEEYAKFLKRDADAQREAMIKNGGFKTKLLEKYASLGKKGKIAVALGSGALIAATGGFALVVAGGLVGGAAATATAGALARGLRTVKTYATLKSRLYAPKDESRFDVQLASGDNETAAVEKILNKLRQESRQDIEDGDKWKKRAVYGAVGAAALGSLGGALVSHASDASSFLGVTDRTPGWVGGKVGDAIAGPEIDHTSTPVEWDVKPTAEPTRTFEYNKDAETMSRAEGGYKTLQALGVDRSHYAELWQKVAPKLHEIDNGAGRPLTYEMNGKSGEWGFRMTPDGKMPPEALDLIVKEHESMYGSVPGGVKVTEVAPAVDTTPTAAEATATSTELSASELQTLENIVKSPTIDAAEISRHPELLNELARIAPNASAEEFARVIGLPHEVWEQNVEPYIAQQLAVGNANFQNVFEDRGGEVVFTGRANLTPEGIAEILRAIPDYIRNSFAVVR